MSEGHSTERSPTFLHRGVQLGDLHGQLVHPLLQAAHPQVEAVGLVEQLAEDVLCVAAWRDEETLD